MPETRINYRIKMLATIYLKSEVEVRDDEDLVREVGDFVKFTRSSMLGQIGCRNGKMILGQLRLEWLSG